MKPKISEVSARAQVVIPAKLEMEFGIGAGTPIAFFDEIRRLLIQPLTLEYVMNLRGLLKGKLSPLETMMDERKREKKYETRRAGFERTDNLFHRRRGRNEGEDFLMEEVAKKHRLLMSTVNWGEVYNATWRDRGKDVAERIISEISHLPIEIQDANYETTKMATEFRAQYALPYAGSFAASLSRRRNASAITADPDFFALKKKIVVEFISVMEKSWAEDRAKSADLRARRESREWR